MPLVAKVIATVGFLGYVPVAPGTAGSLVGWLVGLLLLAVGAGPLTMHPAVLALATWTGLAACFGLGVAASQIVERDAGEHDPSAVVIDEFVGMWVVVAACPFVLQVPWMAVAAFVLFRLFDMTKPPPLKWLSRTPGGWGIMLDDLGASGYTALILWLIVFALTQFQSAG
jgi:phosphatidylglycerophosphatase A